MSNLRDLYQEVIIDHNRSPRNFYKLATANYHAEGFNPLCGDKLSLYLLVENDIIKQASFEGVGCAISTASASLMTEQLPGKTVADAEKMFAEFHQLITQNSSLPNQSLLGKLVVLAGIKEFPARVKCATLAWHTLQAALKQQQKPISTE